MSSSPATFYEQLPLPTIDRPFGIHLWPIFDKAWTAVVGYSVNDFKFVPFETPMSTLKSTSIFIVIYYAIIFGGREFMRNREPYKLKTLFLIHNFYLTAISGILLALFIEQLLPTVVRGGIFHAICDAEGGWTQPLVVLYYVSISRLDILYARTDCHSSTTSPSTSNSSTPSSCSSRRSL
jgi:fatty acid elongase 3